MRRSTFRVREAKRWVFLDHDKKLFFNSKKINCLNKFIGWLDFNLKKNSGGLQMMQNSWVHSTVWLVLGCTGSYTLLQAVICIDRGFSWKRSNTRSTKLYYMVTRSEGSELLCTLMNAIGSYYVLLNNSCKTSVLISCSMSYDCTCHTPKSGQHILTYCKYCFINKNGTGEVGCRCSRSTGV